MLMNLIAFELALLTAFCWGAAAVLGKLALRDLSALNFNAIRFSLAAAVIVPITLLSGGLDGHELGLILLAVSTGVLGWFVGDQLFFHALKFSPAHRIIPAGYTYPLWAILLAPLLLGEVFNPLLPISAALITGGAFLLLHVKKKFGQWKAGVALALLVAFIWGLKAILNKFLLNMGMESITLLTISIVSAAVLFVLTAWFRHFQIKARFSKRSVGLSLASGALAFPIGEFSYLAALGMGKVSTLTTITSTTILFGFLLSLILVKERPTWMAALGMVLTFVGVFLVTL